MTDINRGAIRSNQDILNGQEFTETPSQCLETAILLPALNEEDTIGRTIRSIFEQDFEEPFEIILSDHSSHDRTLDIMRDMAERYDGPHRIRLFQAPREYGDTIKGMNQHVNWLMDRLGNKFFIQSCADDVEWPNRVRRMVETWRETGAGYVTGTQEFILPSGVKYESNIGQTRFVQPEEQIKELFRNPSMNGASCWDAQLWRRYGPLPGRWASDLVMPVWGGISTGAYHLGEIVRTFYITGKQTGYGSQFMASTDAIKQIQLNERMSFDRIGMSMYYIDMLELEIRRETHEVPYVDKVTAEQQAQRIKHLRWMYARALNSMFVRTADYCTVREELMRQQIPILQD